MSAVQSNDLLYVSVAEERLKIPVSVILTSGVGLSAVDAQVNQAFTVVLLGGHVRPTVCQGKFLFTSVDVMVVGIDFII